MTKITTYDKVSNFLLQLNTITKSNNNENVNDDAQLCWANFLVTAYMVRCTIVHYDYNISEPEDTNAIIKYAEYC